MPNFSTQTENALQPNLIEEVDDNLTYLGFALQGDETRTAIIRITKTGSVSRFECPINGNFSFEHTWANRVEYDYKLKRL
jgi:hypothetical protein